MAHKYGAKKTTIDGITFDSRAEGFRYTQLKMLLKAGKITDLELQPKFEIIPAHVHPITKKKIRAAYYIADFKYNQNGETIIEDVKGAKTEAYILKKKLVEYRYGILIQEVSA